MTPRTRVPADHDARERIRTALDDTLLVEAAAGTGKTTELVFRIVNLLASGRTTVDRVVAVTFTEKAAGELKLRLRERLEIERAATSDAVRAGHLSQALARLEEARINTIHGFCADLLRERPVEARVDPAFEVLVESGADRLYARVFADWLASRLESPPEGLRRALARRWEDEDEDDAGPVDRLRRAGWDLVTWRDFPSPWRRDSAFDRRAALRRLVGRLEEFAVLSGSPARRGDNFYADTAFLRDACRELQQASRLGRIDPDETESRLVALARHRLRSRMRKGSGAEYAPGIPRSAAIVARDTLLSELDAFVAAADADLAALLRDELGETADRYQEAKIAAGQLDFVDLLSCARDLVRDHADVRADFQRRIDHLFVDEFQDTDPIQAEVLLLLASSDPAVDDWHRVPVAPGKLFIVADPKQSIYRFRRADVGIYEEVKRILGAQGVRPLTLSTSFRGRPEIQRFVNRVFSPLMQRTAGSLQAEYVPLVPWREDRPDQPSIVALPVPDPYGVSLLSGAAIDESLPDAVGAFVHWLLTASGWRVTERTRRDGAETLVPVKPRHVCLLFRRFESWGRDVTRPYVEALEARDVPHLLVGGRSFANREEVSSIEAALSAIEWPDDELSVFATLRGGLFALPDPVLLAWRREVGRFSPFHVPDGVAPELAEVAAALRTLRHLHFSRNRVPIANTIGALLDATRAHAGLVLRPSGEQALANVLHVAELARRHEAAGGVSFRGFVEDLVEGRFSSETDAPILEEGGDGVRMMTLHKAKGLEFPVVIVVDITANLSARRASRHLHPSTGLCAIPLAGCRPLDLLEHEADELRHDREEGVRVAYVAATRARDLLVVPAVGDEPYGTKDRWVGMLNEGLYPPPAMVKSPIEAAGCPTFKGKDTVRNRPGGDAALVSTVAPGRYEFLDTHRQDGDGPEDAPAGYAIVWWDPAALVLDEKPTFGLRETELIGRDAESATVANDVARFHAWESARADVLAAGAVPSATVARATSLAAERAAAATAPAEPIEVVDVRTARRRIAGARYGSLVHAVLALTSLDASPEELGAIARAQARLLGATDAEIATAIDAAALALAHPVLASARRAGERGECRREWPVTLIDTDGTIVEGQLDLAFLENGAWIVVDFKTDRDLERGLATYTRQVEVYARAMSEATGRPARGLLMLV